MKIGGKKLKAIFISFVGSSNIGDTLIVELLNDFIQEEFVTNKYNFALVPENELLIESEAVKLNNNKKVLIRFYQKYLRNSYIFDKFHAIKNKKKIKENPRLIGFRKELKKVDVLIIGGGNVLYDFTPQSESSYALKIIIEEAKKLKKKIFVTSIGIGPFQNNKQISKVFSVLNDVDYITFRDERYKKYLKNINLKEEKYLSSIDPVFLLETEKKEHEINMEKIKIAVCLLDYRLNKATEDEYKNYIESMKEIILKLGAMKNIEVILFSTEVKDYLTVNEIFASLKNEKRISMEIIETKKELLEFYSKIDFLIGTRMHSMIVAASQYIPFVGISWQPKVEEMFILMNEEDSVFFIEKLDVEVDNIIQKSLDKIDNYSGEVSKLKEFKKNAKQKFQINKNILREIAGSIEKKD